MCNINFISKLLSICLITFGLFGCSSPSVTQYANEKPNLDLSEYFNGTIDAYGIFTDRSGEVKKRFTVLLVAQWKVIDGKKVPVLFLTIQIFAGGMKQKKHLDKMPKCLEQ